MTAPYHLLFPYVPSPVAHCRVEGYWETTVMEYWLHLTPFSSRSLSFCWVWGRAGRPC